MDNNSQSIAQQLLSLSGKDRRISCAAARKLAEDMKVDYIVVGNTCDELKIKIHGCELGCFK